MGQGVGKTSQVLKAQLLGAAAPTHPLMDTDLQAQ